MNYYDEHAAELSKPNARHMAVLDMCSRFVKPGMSVLDLGCGAGITTAGMRAFGAEVVGVDSSEALIKHARDTHHGEFVHADITEVSLGRTFDVLTLIDCIEHIEPEKWLGLISVIREHAKGLVFLNYPFPPFIDHIRETQPELLQPIDNPPEFWKLAESMHGLGFQPVTVTTYGIDVPGFQYVAALFARGNHG